MYAAIGADGPIFRQKQGIDEGEVTSFLCFAPAIIRAAITAASECGSTAFTPWVIPASAVIAARKSAPK